MERKDTNDYKLYQFKIRHLNLDDKKNKTEIQKYTDELDKIDLSFKPKNAVHILRDKKNGENGGIVFWKSIISPSDQIAYQKEAKEILTEAKIFFNN